MRPGTPSFVGERLRMAREARGLSAIALADLILVSRQAVSQYENGLSTPAPTTLQRLSEVLRFPSHFFLRPLAVTNDGVIFYRSMSSATKVSRARAERRFQMAREYVTFLRRYVELPKVNFPQLDLPRNPLEISAAQVEEAATSARRFWRLGDGPISDVTLLLENNGVVVFRHDLGADKLDAFSMWSASDEKPFVVLGADKGSAVRSRHDIAHELGHLILHRYLPAIFLSRAEEFGVIEGQAHAFARAFMMPQRTFSPELFTITLDSLRAIKPKWRVSIQAMLMRAKELMLLSEEQSRRLWINLSRRGWRMSEPLDDTLEPESPRLLRRATELLLRSGHVTRQDVVFQNATSAEDIESLIGLETGTLQEGGAVSDGHAPRIIRFPSAG